MDRHEQFLAQHTSDVKHLIKWNSKTLASSTTLFSAVHQTVNDSYKHRDSLEILETLRTVFCLCYQYTFWSDKVKKDYVPVMRTLLAINKLDIDKIQSSLDDQLKKSDFCHWTEVVVVLDILVLHMTLYMKVSDIFQKLEEWQNLIHQHLEEHNELTIFHIKLLDCYIDSVFLHKKRGCIIDKLEVEKVKALYLQNLELWLKLKDQENCDLLVVILPKLIKVGEVLTKVWDMILTLQNSRRTVSMLQLTADIWFPVESEHIEVLINQTLEERLWLLLLKELSSSLPPQSMPALEVVKRIIDFVQKHRTEDLQFPNYQELRPLVCIGNDSQQGIFRKNLNNLFLVLEELDKDEHYVTPEFELLKNMFIESPDIHGIHIAWIRCAYSRILQDLNADITQWGLQEVLRFGPELYNDELLDVLLDILRDSYYYINYENQEDPPIVKQLIRLLNDAELKKSDLVTKFLVGASKKDWCHTALFYIIHALSVVYKIHSVWREVELEAVKSLAVILSTMECPILRIGSQIELLETVTHFATEPLDLLTVANTLSAFPTSEVLTRGHLAWNRTTAWLSKLMKEEEAIKFLENICAKISHENSSTEINMKSLSLIILLCHDARLLLNPNSCREFFALHNLLNCLIEENSGPHHNSELEKRSIELVNYLLDLRSSKDCTLYQFISKYEDAILQFVFRNLRYISDEGLIENIDTYVQVTQKLFTTDSSSATIQETLRHHGRFETESLNIIEDKQWGTNVRRLFGIKILRACLRSTCLKRRNYNFIRPLCRAYKVPVTQPSKNGVSNDSQNTDGKLNDKIASEYYKFVAQLFCDYLEDEPVDKWLSDINWIKEVSYLIQVGGKDIFTPLVGMLSQIFFKKALAPKDIDHSKDIVRLCWKSTLGVKECGSATQAMTNLLFSSPFLERVETRELAIECAREMTEKGERNPELRVILLSGLKHLEGKYFCHFYDTVLPCLLHRSNFNREKKIKHQASFYVLERYQAVYPNYLFNIKNANINVLVRLHAVTLIHKMITDDSTHAVKLFPLILGELNDIQKNRDYNEYTAYQRENQIWQSLVVLQPVLKKDEIESLHTQLCRNIFPEKTYHGVRLMQELLLTLIYRDNENLRAKVWELFEQRHATEVHSICSIFNIVYHVALLLPTDQQLDFINSAFDYIMPCSMSQHSVVRWHTQALTSQFCHMASKNSCSTVAEKYKALYTALTQSFKFGTVRAPTLDHFQVMFFHPIDEYSLETLFYELPRLDNPASVEYIPLQMLEKFDFQKANSHPLKLLNVRNNVTGI